MSLLKRFKKATGAFNVNDVNYFFTEHNVNGFMSKPDLCQFAMGLTDTQFVHFEELLTYLNIRCKITNRLEGKLDFKTQEHFIWVHVELKNGKRRLPIPYDEGIMKFLIQYQQEGIPFEFDFETLLAEAGVNFSEIRD